MEKFIINGGVPLKGDIRLQGAKNVALKMFVAAILTEEEIILHNVPHIRDVAMMAEVMRELGVSVAMEGNTATLIYKGNGETLVPLEVGARLRTSSLVLGPLLARRHEATVPNPGGCRLGARPIDRHIDALRAMGADIQYDSSDGYFHARSNSLHGTTIRFEKNTHTGTEAVILAAVLAKGTTVIENAAKEVEIDDLIALLCQMGARIQRTASGSIVIDGVDSLRGAEYTIMGDRNEEVTFAIAAGMTRGDIVVHDSQRAHLSAFLDAFEKAGGIVNAIDEHTTRYRVKERILPVDIETRPHPGFMTDWQGPWAVFMTQANGVSRLHETVFENRFSYVKHLWKMGADIRFYDPPVSDPETFYNFHWKDRIEGTYQAIEIHGPTRLHNAVVEMDDIRAGATLILAALSAEGESYLYEAENVDRGYERIEDKLRSLGANIERVKEDDV